MLLEYRRNRTMTSRRWTDKHSLRSIKTMLILETPLRIYFSSNGACIWPVFRTVFNFSRQPHINKVPKCPD